MTQYTKPSVKPAWGELKTDAANMVQPTDAEIQAGWPLTNTPPSRKRWNWILNWVFNGMRYFMQRGLVDYDATETYMTGARIIGDDGKTYASLVDNNTGNTPSTSPTKWELWGFRLSEMLSKAVAITALTGSAKLPVGTTAQRDGAPASGWMRYNTTLDKPEVYSEAKGAWGSVGGGATGSGADEIFILNGQTITQDFTVPAGKNAGTFGPVAIANGVTVTISNGSTWTIN